MELNEIPQDDSRIFRGQKKIIYATQNGHYQPSTSTGWQTEEFATHQAVDALNELTEQALQTVKKGEKSVLYYLMYKYRFDEQSLAQATGFWQWQIKRHFRPEVWNNLPIKKLAKYAETFGISINNIWALPEEI